MVTPLSTHQLRPKLGERGTTCKACSQLLRLLHQVETASRPQNAFSSRRQIEGVVQRSFSANLRRPAGRSASHSFADCEEFVGWPKGIGAGTSLKVKHRGHLERRFQDLLNGTLWRKAKRTVASAPPQVYLRLGIPAPSDVLVVFISLRADSSLHHFWGSPHPL